MLQGIALFGIIIVLYGALAGRLGRWSITAPMIFVAAGFVLGPGGLNLHQVTPRTEGIKELTEITLALLLFADASTLSFRQVRDDAMIPLRLPTRPVGCAPVRLVRAPAGQRRPTAGGDRRRA